jgi:hypothetical protein
MKWLLVAFIIFMIYKNLNWLKYMWKEHVIDWCNHPPCCFECNKSTCHDCEEIIEWYMENNEKNA